MSLDVAHGSCTVLCGRSGDGKSTVLRLIDGLAGTFFPGEREGAVLVDGADVLDLSPRQRTEGMGVVMQDPRSQFFMGIVADEIAFSLENRGAAPNATVARVRIVAELCGVGRLLPERLTELSSGQKQAGGTCRRHCVPPEDPRARRAHVQPRRGGLGGARQDLGAFEG